MLAKETTKRPNPALLALWRCVCWTYAIGTRVPLFLFRLAENWLTGAGLLAWLVGLELAKAPRTFRRTFKTERLRMTLARHFETATPERN